MASPLIGTGIVTGGNAVAWTGAVLTKANCFSGMPVVINKQASFIATRVDTTHFTVAPPVDNGTGLSVAISPLNADNVQVAELNVRAAELMENLSVIDANGRGLFYKLLGLTGPNDPQPTFLARNAANWEDVTALYFDAQDANNQPAMARILLWNIGTVVTVRSLDSTSNAFASYVLTEIPTSEDTGEWAKITGLVYKEGDGLLADNEAVAVEWNRMGTGFAAIPSGDWAIDIEYPRNGLVQHGGYIFLSNADGNLGNEPDISPAPTSSDDWTYLPLPAAGDFMDLAFFAEGVYDSAALLYRFEFADTAKFEQDLPQTVFSAQTAPTAAKDMYLKKNGVTFATIHFAIGATEATFVAGSDTVFNSGDILTWEAPTVADVTLAGVSGTLRGLRDASLSLLQGDTIEVDFGAFPGKTDTSLVVTGQGRLLLGSIVHAHIAPGAGTVEHTADEHIAEFIQITVGALIPGVGFTIYAVAMNNRLYGRYNVSWSWI